jgi:hypothetical protein
MTGEETPRAVKAWSELLFSVIDKATEPLKLMAIAIAASNDDENRREKERLWQYEKRTMVLERIADALGHYNEQKFHTT